MTKGVMTMEAKGKSILKVSGILLIIFGAIGLISTIISLVGASAIGAMAGAMGVDTGAYNALITVSGIIAIACGAVYLVAGILGVLNAAKPEKAKTCMILGVIMVALQVVSTIFSIIVSGFSGTAVISLIIGLVLPVLFIVGANQNKQSSGTPPQA